MTRSYEGAPFSNRLSEDTIQFPFFSLSILFKTSNGVLDRPRSASALGGPENRCRVCLGGAEGKKGGGLEEEPDPPTSEGVATAS